jgi:transcriptional regulator with XRE-family HTH domain
MKKHFANLLKRKLLEISLSKGEIITQSEFARMLGIPQGSMSQYINGTRLPNEENTHKIAKKLGIEVYQILDMPIPLPDDPNIKNLVIAYQALPSNKKQTYLDLIINEAEKYKS